mmetsp:Transcript_143197/g.373166  ORF Transcript_143197/g.373166 Transcript_143197/m.373166 type:complete len:299 (-) Transcript_143197:49-945(-)
MPMPAPFIVFHVLAMVGTTAGEVAVSTSSSALSFWQSSSYDMMRRPRSAKKRRRALHEHRADHISLLQSSVVRNASADVGSDDVDESEAQLGSSVVQENISDVVEIDDEPEVVGPASPPFALDDHVGLAQLNNSRALADGGGSGQDWQPCDEYLEKYKKGDRSCADICIRCKKKTVLAYLNLNSKWLVKDQCFVDKVHKFTPAMDLKYGVVKQLAITEYRKHTVSVDVVLKTSLCSSGSEASSLLSGHRKKRRKKKRGNRRKKSRQTSEQSLQTSELDSSCEMQYRSVQSVCESLVQR